MQNTVRTTPNIHLIRMCVCVRERKRERERGWIEAIFDKIMAADFQNK